MIAAVIFSNNVWTFWDVVLLFFLFIPLLMVWFFCIFDVFRRRDIGGGAKALWLLVIVIFPWIGSLAYLIFRPWQQDVYATSYASEVGAGGPRPTAGQSTGGPASAG